MGICVSGNLFQAKVYKLLGNIEGIKIYINDILVLIKDRLYNHIEQLMIIFGRLRAIGLKVNIPNGSFGWKEIPYLGCVMTWEGIKPDP